MAADTNYEVSTELKVVGAKAYQDDFRKGAAGANELHAALGKLGRGSLGVATGAFGALESAVKSFAAVASVALGGGLYFGTKIAEAVGSDMASLEGSAIQLGAVIGAATGQGFAKGSIEANKLFAQFQDDAIKSAGETGDFVDIAKSMSGAVLGATNSMAELHDMTTLVVAASTAVGESFDQAGRDAQHILDGTAGNEVALWRTLRAMKLIKVEAKEFNQLDPKKRFDLFKKAISDPAFLDAAEAFGNSWKGLTSSFSDSMKALGRAAGSPVFGFLKTQLAAVNTALQGQAKGGPLRDALELFGARAHVGLMDLRDALGDLFPDAVGSASGFVDALGRVVSGGLHRLADATRFVASHWEQIRSAVERTEVALARAAVKGEAFITAVGGGDFGKGAERVGGAVLGLKAADALGVPEMAASGALAVSGAAGTARALGLFGGGAAAASSGGAASSGATAAAVGGAALGAVGLAAVAVALEAVGAAAIAVEHNSLGTRDMFLLFGASLKQGTEALGAALGPLWESMKRLWSAVEPIVGVFGALILHASPFGAMIRVLGVAIPILEVALSKLAEGATAATNAVAAIIEKLTLFLGIKKALDPVDESEEEARDRARRDAITFRTGGAGVSTAKTLVDVAKDLGKKDPQKVEVTLKIELGDGNEDALYIRTGRDIVQAFERARDNPSTFRLRTT